ncbi:glycoside hydrolase [Nocardia sp. XZ_19_385]|uniref:glycoside hydrolase n=1 Tax=Nocardia sp. XZ_19_385 TaxID=2769488 RepID=UPI001E5A81C7|nr:glycoside hydrolase [Nocardia sp. XZ_19_385]
MLRVELNRRSLMALAAGLPLHALLCGRATGAPMVAPATTPALRYTMVAFTNNSQIDLYVYESADATTFQLLKASAYQPPGADPATPATDPTEMGPLLRDPSLFRSANGRYYLVYTTAWDGDTLGFACSDDLSNWTHMYDYRVPVSDVRHAWAPEWFLDPSGQVNVLVSLNTGAGFTPHLMTATDTQLSVWTPPTPLDGLAPSPGSENGYIDTTVVHHHGRYYAFVKNELTKFVELAVADQLAGPYTVEWTGDWAGWGSPREGQCVIRLPHGGWRIYLDAYNLDDPRSGRYLYSDSIDDFTEWTLPQPLPAVSGTIRHGTVLAELR